MKAARIFSKTERATNSDMMVLAGGKGGRGKKLYSCYYWPESYQSGSMAIRYCMNAAKQAEIDRLFIESDASDGGYGFPDSEYVFQDGNYELIEE